MSNPTSILNKELTKQQYKASTNLSKALLCLACAGSGKTRTLAYRIAYLISKGVQPEEIVAFTFTDKATESMKRRVADALEKMGQPTTIVGRMSISTIHAFCLDLLCSTNSIYRQYTVLDPNRLILYIMSRANQLKLWEIMEKRKQRYFQTIKDLSDAWSVSNMEMLDLQKIAKADDVIGQSLLALKTQLHKDKYIDYSYMVRHLIDVLKSKNLEIKEQIAKIKHLMVDEYQDVDPSQEELIKYISKTCETLFVVGDDDQSIYNWRGANVSNILTFKKRYKTQAEHELSTNFRSTAEIVKASDQFARKVLTGCRLTKSPVSHSEGNVRDFRNLWFGSKEEEADWIANRIKQLLGTKYEEIVNGKKTYRGLTYSDFTILIRSMKRSHNTDGKPPYHHEYAEALKCAKIPYDVDIEGSIFERGYAVALREMLEVLREESPTREQVEEKYKTFVLPWFPKADLSKICSVINETNRLVHLGRTFRRSIFPQQFVINLLDAFNVAKTDLSDQALRDLGVFSNIISDVENVFVSVDSASRYREMLNFLSNIAESGYDSGLDKIYFKPDVVTISTIHKMKGLESPVIFIVNVINQRFPGRTSGYSGLIPSSVMDNALKRGAYQTHITDEARLFYTAMTRAERFLYITGAAHQTDRTRECKPSEFKLIIDSQNHCSDKKGLPKGIEKTKKQQRIEDNIIPTNYSELKDYLLCPMKYKFQYIYGFKPAISEMYGFGSTTHSIISRLHQLKLKKAPSIEVIDQVVDELFTMQHVFPSNDPKNKPGPYENAKEKAREIIKEYIKKNAKDFSYLRDNEVKFEFKHGKAMVTGSIDLLLKEDSRGKVTDAHVIDFKTMETPDDNSDPDWVDVSLQVQLYAHAANEVLNHNAKTGSVHFLRENKRHQIPVDKPAIESALSNIEWAVENISMSDFPKRPCKAKCSSCDYCKLCDQKASKFKKKSPEKIHLPNGKKQIVSACE